MHFPPPTRYYAPLLVLVFGLAATWFDYQLNLENDLARNFGDVAAQSDATGLRLAQIGEQRLGAGQAPTLVETLAGWSDEPWMKLAALVDEKGLVVADSAQGYTGQPASKTPVAAAMKLTRDAQGNVVKKAVRKAEGGIVLGAYPMSLGPRGMGWALVVFDRTDAEAQARVDALQQLRWVAGAITILCFCLWAALHVGVSSRLARLIQAVRDFGEGRTDRVVTVPGGDEVHELSLAFATMGKRLAEREAERARLEREVLESSERERRRIGHDLHDGLGQQLTAAALASSGLVAALEASAPALAPMAENLGQQLRATIAEVRALSHGLSPVPLGEEGLTDALHALASSTGRNTGVRCVFECTEPVPISDPVLAGHLYRIAQEAINNALKHASPAEIRVALERRETAIALEIDDDGTGLPDVLAGGGGIGLRVMRYRTQLMGGTFEFGSPPAGGTRIACHIPLPS